MKGIRSFRARLKKEVKVKSFKKAFDEEDFFARLAIQFSKLILLIF